VTLLSNRELEPYFVYEWAAKEFLIDSTAISPEDLANTTQALYSIRSLLTSGFLVSRMAEMRGFRRSCECI
jgi:hypothetical protein